MREWGYRRVKMAREIGRLKEYQDSSCFVESEVAIVIVEIGADQDYI